MKEKLCELCQIVTIPRRNQRYCGSQHKKTGCSYKMKLMTNHKYYLRFIENHPNIIQEKQKKRLETGYYKQPKIVESRRKTRRKMYEIYGK